MRLFVLLYNLACFFIFVIFKVDVRVNYGDELESLIRSTVEGGSVDQIRDLLIAEVS